MNAGLILLAEYCESHHEFLKNTDARKDLETFDMFDQVGRYGGAAKFDPLSKGKSVGDTQFSINPDVQVAGLWMWSNDHLNRLDRIIYNLRGRLNFKTAKIQDGLISILLDDKNHRLTGTWQGPLPLKEVLTKQNSYFNEAVLNSASPDKF